jgi:hypothetical protein
VASEHTRPSAEAVCAPTVLATAKITSAEPSRARSWTATVELTNAVPCTLCVECALVAAWDGSLKRFLTFGQLPGIEIFTGAVLQCIHAGCCLRGVVGGGSVVHRFDRPIEAASPNGLFENVGALLRRDAAGFQRVAAQTRGAERPGESAWRIFDRNAGGALTISVRIVATSGQQQGRTNEPMDTELHAIPPAPWIPAPNRISFPSPRKAA